MPMGFFPTIISEFRANRAQTMSSAPLKGEHRPRLTTKNVYALRIVHSAYVPTFNSEPLCIRVCVYVLSLYRVRPHLPPQW